MSDFNIFAENDAPSPVGVAGNPSSDPINPNTTPVANPGDKPIPESLHREVGNNRARDVLADLGNTLNTLEQNAAANPNAPRKRGRPPGSKNKPRDGSAAPALQLNPNDYDLEFCEQLVSAPFELLGLLSGAIVTGKCAEFGVDADTHKKYMENIEKTWKIDEMTKKLGGKSLRILILRNQDELAEKLPMYVLAGTVGLGIAVRGVGTYNAISEIKGRGSNRSGASPVRKDNPS